MADPTAEAGATPAPDATSGAEQETAASSSSREATSRDDVGDAGKRALAEMRRELKQIKQERDTLKAAADAVADAERSELEKATTRAEAAERRTAELEHESLARTAAIEAGIPEWWDRLKGANADELASDAQKVAAGVGARSPEQQQQRVSTADLGAGAREQSTPATGSAGFSETIRRRARR